MSIVSLRRTVRFSLPPPGRSDAFGTSKSNPYAGWPSSSGLCPYGEIAIEARGEPDPASGYLVNISDIDRTVREELLPWLAEAAARQYVDASVGPADPAALVPELVRRSAPRLAATAPAAQIVLCEWRPTPSLAFRFRPAMPDFVEIAQRFEFSASHRLHCRQWSEEQNRAVFGKCNNANGHGHNYRVEVSVRVPLASEVRFGPPQLERIVDDVVIRRFDHKHLNADCPEFADLNPSVEHIAMVCHRLLAEPLERSGATLARVTVWETEKTSASYPA